MTAANAIRHLATVPLPLRWSDMDAFGHLNNARIFTYFEEARIRMLEDHAGDWTGDAGPVVVHAACSYKRPLVHPATLVVHLGLDEPSRTSFNTRYVVMTEEQPDTVHAYGEVRLVWVTVATGRPTRLPDLFRSLYDGAQADVDRYAVFGER
jgi:acyl-CoA thioester hydrolase